MEERNYKEEISKCEETIGNITKKIAEKEEVIKDIEKVISIYEKEDDELCEKIKNLHQVIKNEKITKKYGFFIIVPLFITLCLALLKVHLVFSIFMMLIGGNIVIEQFEQRKKIKAENKQNPDYEKYKNLSKKERKDELRKMEYESIYIIGSKIDALYNEKDSIKKEKDQLELQLVEESRNLANLESNYINSLLQEWAERRKRKEAREKEIKEGLEEEFLSYLKEEESNRFYPVEVKEIPKMKRKIQNNMTN